MIAPEDLVNGCLRLLGNYELADESRRMLVAQAEKDGDFNSESEEFPAQVGQLLQMIAVGPERNTDGQSEDRGHECKRSRGGIAHAGFS